MLIYAFPVLYYTYTMSPLSSSTRITECTIRSYLVQFHVIYFQVLNYAFPVLYLSELSTLFLNVRTIYRSCGRETRVELSAQPSHVGASPLVLIRPPALLWASTFGVDLPQLRAGIRVE